MVFGNINEPTNGVTNHFRKGPAPKTKYERTTIQNIDEHLSLAFW